MAVTAYLQQFLNEISKLPDNIKNSLYEITKVEQMSTTFEDDSLGIDQIIHRINNSTINQIDYDALEQLKQKLNRNLTFSSKKIDIINKLYNIIDHEVNRLDNDLKNFENEISIIKPQPTTNIDDDDAVAAATTTTTTTNLVSSSSKKPIIKNGVTTKCSTTSRKANHTHSNNIELVAGLDMPIDPNEPTYCLCHQVSYGNMVMCDNNKCPYEWFHYGCVGLLDQPKGKWFCPKCKTIKKRPSSRRRRR